MEAMVHHSRKPCNLFKAIGIDPCSHLGAILQQLCNVSHWMPAWKPLEAILEAVGRHPGSRWMPSWKPLDAMVSLLDAGGSLCKPS
jgi:hypothetical protein